MLFAPAMNPIIVMIAEIRYMQTISPKKQAHCCLWEISRHCSFPTRRIPSSFDISSRLIPPIFEILVIVTSEVRRLLSIISITSSVKSDFEDSFLV